MRWPQITIIVLLALGWIVTLARHGQPKTGLSAREDIGITTASTALFAWLLWCGEFFG